MGCVAVEFHQLPTVSLSTAENMAQDQLLLEAYPMGNAIRMRQYAWKDAAAFTFGYSQNYTWVCQQTPVEDAVRIRRATGGGIVDHRNDWTYALVIPPTHHLHHGKAEIVYRLVHDALAKALTECGMAAELAGPRNESHGLQGLCFAEPECADVVASGTHIKLAGAAMKRNRHGLLLQGSVERSKAKGIQNWSALADIFPRKLAECMQCETPKYADWPEYPDEKVAALKNHFASKKWNEKR